MTLMLKMLGIFPHNFTTEHSLLDTLRLRDETRELDLGSWHRDLYFLVAKRPTVLRGPSL